MESAPNAAHARDVTEVELIAGATREGFFSCLPEGPGAYAIEYRGSLDGFVTPFAINLSQERPGSRLRVRFGRECLSCLWPPSECRFAAPNPCTLRRILRALRDTGGEAALRLRVPGDVPELPREYTIPRRRGRGGVPPLIDMNDTREYADVEDVGLGALRAAVADAAGGACPGTVLELELEDGEGVSSAAYGRLLEGKRAASS